MIRTFHSAAMALLRQYIGEFPESGRTPDFSVADPTVQLALVKEAIAERNFDLKANRPESFLWRIGRYPDELADPESLLARQPTHDLMDWPRVLQMIRSTDRYVNRLTAEIWKRYEDKLRRNNMLDFDDLINLFARMLREKPDIRARTSSAAFAYLQVDEFQDTNVAQLTWCRLLAGERQNVMAVGDDAPVDLPWRSADIRNILSSSATSPGRRRAAGAELPLHRAIIQAANRLIAQNTGQRPKRLFTDRPRAAPWGARGGNRGG